MVHINMLPPELFAYMLEFVPSSNHYIIASVCRKWYVFICDLRRRKCLSPRFRTPLPVVGYTEHLIQWVVKQLTPNQLSYAVAAVGNPNNVRKLVLGRNCDIYYTCCVLIEYNHVDIFIAMVAEFKNEISITDDIIYKLTGPANLNSNQYKKYISVGKKLSIQCVAAKFNNVIILQHLMNTYKLQTQRVMYYIYTDALTSCSIDVLEFLTPKYWQASSSHYTLIQSHTNTLMLEWLWSKNKQPDYKYFVNAFITCNKIHFTWMYNKNYRFTHEDYEFYKFYYHPNNPMMIHFPYTT
jgi:hypothetical protein